MKNSSRFGLLAAVALVAGATPALAQSSTPAGVTEASIAKGKEIYSKSGYCFACHGAEAKGGIGPNLTDSEWIHIKGGYDEIVALVTSGVPKEKSKSGNMMPPKGGASLSDEDVKAVAAYVYSLSHPKQ